MINIIMAISKNGVIGKDGKLPWHQAHDLNRFKLLTWHRPVIMGRKTWESIPGILPCRIPIVLSRSGHLPSGALVATSLEQALNLVNPIHMIFIAGGRQVFTEGFHVARAAYITRIEAEVEGDVTFDLDPHLEGWKLLNKVCFDANDCNEYPYSFEWWRNGKLPGIRCR